MRKPILLITLLLALFLIFPACNKDDLTSNQEEQENVEETEEEIEEEEEEVEEEEETEEEIVRDSETLQIEGRFLYTAAGEKVIMRGVNEMMIWSGNRSGSTILPEIAQTGANAIRLVWLADGTGSLADLDELIANSIRNGMIPMVEMHDATGDWTKLPAIIDYWLQDDVKAVMDKYKKWVLLNIANEVGGTSGDDVAFRDNYKDAITKLRDKGYKLPLIIDAPNWGQDEGVIARNWEEVLNHDPIKNLMFSVHTYWVNNRQQRLDDFLNLVVNEGMPFLFGEGPQPNGWDCTTPFPYENCMLQCQEKEIGWLNWSWGAVKNGDCSGNDSPFDITTNGIYGNWNNDWGRLAMVDDPNSVQNTSIRPQSLIDDADNY